MKRSYDDDELPNNRADLMTHPKSFDKPFPFFRKPLALGSFSLDSGRRFHHDRRQIKYYRSRNSDPGSSYRVSIDLNEGMDRVERKDEEECKKEGLSHLLRWILINRQKFAAPPASTDSHHSNGGNNALNTDFVCFRGCLSTLMCSPFEGREDWAVSAVRCRGTIYLHKEETSAQREQRVRRTDRQMTMCSWGYKFEQQILSDGPRTPSPAAAAADRRLPSSSSSSSSDEAVKEGEEFCCVFRTRLGKHSVVYGAEMDGLVVSDAVSSCSNPEELDLNREEFVELKTTRQIDLPGHERNFRRFKLIKWWCQSFLVGIQTVVAGFRDDAGTVHTVSEYPVREIPRQCADHWQPNVCMNFLHEFLGHVKESLVGTPDLVEVRFSWSPRLRRVIREDTPAPAVPAAGAVAGAPGNFYQQQQQRLLPEWYLQALCPNQ